MNCIFCKIVQKKQSAEVVYEDASVLAFYDIKPKAPVHILIVPKKHIESVAHLGEDDRELLCDMLFTARDIAKTQKIDEGYKLVFNVGRRGGQIIDHMHLHLLGGEGARDLRL
ncbi:MAG: histidine triad nucleotide-binding protein [Candidatus Spechtbacterales bacterium]